MLLETDKVTIGKKIREFRKLNKLTQIELAEKVDLNEKQISRIEMGLNYPTYITFAKLINILNIDLKVFSGNNNEIKDSSKNKLLHLINNSNEKELKIFLDVLSALKQNLDRI